MTTIINSNKNRLSRAILILLLSLPFALMAQNTWTGATNQFWDIATNWSFGTVPTGVDDVVIPNGFTVQIRAASVARTVEINMGASLSIDAGSLDIGSPPSAPPPIAFARLTLLGGTINISSGASLQVRRGRFGINARMGGTIND